MNRDEYLQRFSRTIPGYVAVKQDMVDEVAQHIEEATEGDDSATVSDMPKPERYARRLLKARFGFFWNRVRISLFFLGMYVFPAIIGQFAMDRTDDTRFIHHAGSIASQIMFFVPPLILGYVLYAHERLTGRAVLRKMLVLFALFHLAFSFVFLFFSDDWVSGGFSAILAMQGGMIWFTTIFFAIACLFNVLWQAAEKPMLSIANGFICLVVDALLASGIYWLIFNMDYRYGVFAENISLKSLYLYNITPIVTLPFFVGFVLYRHRLFFKKTARLFTKREQAN